MTVSASSYLVELGDTVNLTVTAPADGVMHALQFDDNSFVLQCENDSVGSYSVVYSHNYSNIGVYLPFVETFNQSVVKDLVTFSLHAQKDLIKRINQNFLDSVN